MTQFERRGSREPHGERDDEGTVSEELVAALRAIRPKPSAEFKTGLDERAAAGFPPRRRDHASTGVSGATGARTAGGESDGGAAGGGGAKDAAAPSPRGWRDRLRLPAPVGRLRPAPVMAGLAVACAIGVAVVVTDPAQLDTRGGGNSSVAIDDGSGAEGLDGDRPAAGAGSPTGESAARQAEELPPSATDSMDIEPGALADPAIAPMPGGGAGGGPLAAQAQERAVERDARLVLGTETNDVSEVAAGVLRVTGAHNGIVLSSSTRDGDPGVAGADFALMIPSGRLSSALTDLSELADVRSRQESSLDITAPTVSTADRLREAQAEVNGLLKQLAEATTDTERETIRIDLRPAQNRVATLRSELNRLERRAAFAQVDVAVVTGDAAAANDDGGWTIADAVSDARDVLVVIAGVAIVALAFLLPAALLFAIVALTRRAWITRERERALRDSGGDDRAA